MKVFEANDEFRHQLNQFYSQQGYHGAWEATERAFICVENDQIVGAVKVELINDVSILRGMYVSESYQNQGIGTRLLQLIEPVLNKHTGYCMPLEHAADFYKKIGFTEVSINKYPDFLKARCLGYIDAGYKIKTMIRERLN